MVGWAMAMMTPTSVTRNVSVGSAPFGSAAYRISRRSVDDDRGAGRRPVPQPNHVVVGDVDAAMSSVVLAGRVIVPVLGARTVHRSPVGVVDAVTTVEPHHHLHLAVRVPVG